MTKALGLLARRIADALRDLAPTILVIAFFQIVVLQQPIPNLGSIVVGLRRPLRGGARRRDRVSGTDRG